MGCTCESTSVLKIIVGNYYTNDTGPADGMIQIKPNALSFEANAVTQGSVNILCGETGPAAVGWRMPK